MSLIQLPGVTLHPAAAAAATPPPPPAAAPTRRPPPPPTIDDDVVNVAAAAVAEMARVTQRLVVIEDNVFTDEAVEEAERLRDPTHVRCHSEDEWKELLTDAGLEVEQLERFERHPVVDDWLARVDASPEVSERVRELLGDRIQDGVLNLKSIVVKARVSQR